MMMMMMKMMMMMIVIIIIINIIIFFYFLRETRTHFKNDIPGKRNSLDDEVNKLRLAELVSSALDVTACFLHHVSSVQRTYHHPYILSPMECSI